MQKKYAYEELLKLLDSHKNADKEWFLSLLDDEKQRAYEIEHLEAVMQLLKRVRIRPHKNAIQDAKDEIAKLEKEGDNAENYRKIKALMAKSEEFRNVLKLGRTQLMDAVPITLGQEFHAYASAVARDKNALNTHSKKCLL